jgi:hypothetical protein
VVGSDSEQTRPETEPTTATGCQRYVRQQRQLTSLHKLVPVRCFISIVLGSGARQECSSLLPQLIRAVMMLFHDAHVYDDMWTAFFRVVFSPPSLLYPKQRGFLYYPIFFQIQSLFQGFILTSFMINDNQTRKNWEWIFIWFHSCLCRKSGQISHWSKTDCSAGALGYSSRPLVG